MRAIRTESAAALDYWFGVKPKVVWRWRASFGVGGHATTPGSRKAIRAAAVRGAAAVQTKNWTDEELDRMSQAAKRRGTHHIPPVAEEVEPALERRVGGDRVKEFDCFLARGVAFDNVDNELGGGVDGELDGHDFPGWQRPGLSRRKRLEPEMREVKTG